MTVVGGMLCKSDKPSIIIIIIMTVGGMGFIPERLLMMMMIYIYIHKRPSRTLDEYTPRQNWSAIYMLFLSFRIIGLIQQYCPPPPNTT